MNTTLRSVVASLGTALCFAGPALSQEVLLRSEATLDTGSIVDYVSDLNALGDDVVLMAGLRGGPVAETVLVARMGPTGVLWSHEITSHPPGSLGGSSIAGEVAIAQGGDEFVGAARYRGYPDVDFKALRVFRLDDSGRLVWMTNVLGDWDAYRPGSTTNTQRCPQVVVLEDDSVVVACTRGMAVGSDDDFWAGVVRISAEGELMWEFELQDPDWSFSVQDVAVAPDGSLRIAGGRFYNSNAGAWSGVNDALYVAKVFPDGPHHWTRTITGPIGKAFTHSSPTTVHVDTNGDVVLTGAVETTHGKFGITVGRIDDEGVLLWQRGLPDSFAGHVVLKGTSMRTDGSIAVIYRGRNTGSPDKVGAVSWTSNGTREWTSELSGADQSLSSGSGAVDSCGNILLWGAPFDPVYCDEFRFLSIDPNGASDLVLESPVCYRWASLVGHGNGRFSHVGEASDDGSFSYNLIKVASLQVTSLSSPADINNDGPVDGADLSILLGEWGSCKGGCLADLSGDGVVDGVDLSILLGSWDECP